MHAPLMMQKKRKEEQYGDARTHTLDRSDSVEGLPEEESEVFRACALLLQL